MIPQQAAQLLIADEFTFLFLSVPRWREEWCRKLGRYWFAYPVTVVVL